MLIQQRSSNSDSGFVLLVSKQLHHGRVGPFIWEEGLFFGIGRKKDPMLSNIKFKKNITKEKIYYTIHWLKSIYVYMHIFGSKSKISVFIQLQYVSIYSC
jgi:hypothetical protein